MADRAGLWSRFLARPNEDPVKALGIAMMVAVVSALVVSTAATALRPRQLANIEAARQARMESMLDALPGLRAVMEAAGVTGLTTRLVDLESGRILTDDPAVFDQVAAARDPERSIALPKETDIAVLGRRENRAPVHLLERDGDVALVVLPIRGTGYQSEIRALLALEADLNTVAALTVTDQAETPGIGAQITNPDWQALWPGREIADADGTIRISVVRGDASGPFEVDGISGATRTGNGVANMVRFWMGPLGYGPFLDRLAREGLR